MRVYRASSLGYSLEALVAPHLGYAAVDPPEWLQEKFDEGNRIEPLAIQRLVGMGWDITIGQREINAIGDQQIEVEIEIIPGTAKIVGHIDARTGGDVIEVKSMAHKTWLQFHKMGWDTPGLVQKYKWQASAYMIATGLPHIMVAWDKETEELCIVPTPGPFYPVEVLAQKVLDAEQYIRDGVLPEGCTDYPCPYFYLHADKDAVPAEQADDELESIMAAWLDADKAEKAHQKEKDRLREQIIAMTTSELAGKVKGACGVTVATTWVEEKTVSYVSKAHWETRVQGPRKNG